jgi:hypothetical protein
VFQKLQQQSGFHSVDKPGLVSGRFRTDHRQEETMRRREFIKAGIAGGAAVTAMAGMHCKAWKHGASEGQLPRRVLGRTGERLSVIGFGGIVVMDEEQSAANRFVAEAVERGVNYFDVAPSYGNAQEKLGPALKPYRKACFLACKTTEREKTGVEKELNESLRILQTDHVDLYQLHALTTLDDVEKAFGPGGAKERPGFSVFPRIPKRRRSRQWTGSNSTAFFSRSTLSAGSTVPSAPASWQGRGKREWAFWL